MKGDGEALYFSKADESSDPVLVGRESFWSNQDSNQGTWQYGGNYDLPVSSSSSNSSGSSWEWAGNYFASSRGESNSVTYGPDGNGGYKEEGSQTWLYGGQLMTESWVYNYDSSKVFTGGYEVRDGLRVVLDKDWNPTGDLVGEDGSTLSITDMVNVSSWSYDPIDQANLGN